MRSAAVKPIDLSSMMRQRRNPRIPLDIPITLEGISVLGKNFRVEAKTSLISRCGATIITDVKVKLGSIIYVVPTFAGPIRAEINGIWIDSNDGLQRVGLKFINPRTWLGD
jgi:hypothetical protein